MHTVHLTQPAEEALSNLQNTQLTPMEEALFKAWAHANGIEKPDAPGNLIDYRGIYKGSGGLVLPQGALAQMTSRANDQSRLEQILQDKLKAHLLKTANEKLQYKSTVDSPTVNNQ